MLFPNITAERARRNMTIDHFALQLGVTSKTVQNWQKSGKIPADKLLIMANMFNCSVDYLLDHEVKKKGG